jgi:arylformamidase
MSARIIDISPLVTERIGVFPGDVPYRRTTSLAITKGDNIDLSSVHTTLHLGAHADAPSHYRKGGASIETRPLDLYFGPCQVVHVQVERGARIQPRDLDVAIEAPRVLFRTDTFLEPNRFDEDFASLSPALVDHLAGSGVRLVGIDTPSVDPCHDPVLESHQALGRHDIANLEGLVLGHVEPGFYTLVALPLRLAGADASPVRAVLMTASTTFPA